MDYKKTCSVVVILFILFLNYSFSQQFYVPQLSQGEYLTRKLLKDELKALKNHQNFEHLISLYKDIFNKPLLKKTRRFYISTIPYVRSLMLTIVKNNLKEYGDKIKMLIFEYLKKDNFNDLIKMLHILPVTKSFMHIWISVVVHFLEEADCYKLRYLFDRFKLRTLLPRFYILSNFCFKKEKYIKEKVSFSLSKFPIKGLIEFMEDMNLHNTKTFFANYGFTKFKDHLIFYNGNTLYKLSIENNMAVVYKVMDGLNNNLKDAYTFEYAINVRDSLISTREVFNIIKFRNHLYFCNLYDREEGKSKAIVRGNNFFVFAAEYIPMKYPRLFRSFVIFDLNKQKVEYFFTGNKNDSAYTKFSCQNLFKLNNEYMIVTGVYGENKEPYSHYVINFDLLNKKIVWQTFISSGFVERNLFNSPVFESWGSPLTCNNTYCVYTNDLGVVASIDHVLGTINWMVNLPIYKFKGTLILSRFDRMPYFTENKPPLIHKNNIFVQIVSNPVVYKININSNIPLIQPFEGDVKKIEEEMENGNKENIIRPFENSSIANIDAPKFFYIYKDHIFFIYNQYLKVKDLNTGEIVYQMSFPEKLIGSPLQFKNMLLIPLSDEIIIFSFETFKIIYQLDTKQKKFITSFYENHKIYLLFKNELNIINVEVGKGEGI